MAEGRRAYMKQDVDVFQLLLRPEVRLVTFLRMRTVRAIIRYGDRALSTICGEHIQLRCNHRAALSAEEAVRRGSVFARRSAYRSHVADLRDVGAR